MKTKIAASLIALTSLAIAAPALAQAPAAPAATATASATASAGALSVEKSTVADIIKNPKAKAALEAALPPISQYYDQIGGMTLAQVAPMSQGALDDAKLKALQVKFDEINAGK